MLPKIGDSHLLVCKGGDMRGGPSGPGLRIQLSKAAGVYSHIPCPRRISMGASYERWLGERLAAQALTEGYRLAVFVIKEDKMDWSLLEKGEPLK